MSSRSKMRSDWKLTPSLVILHNEEIHVMTSSSGTNQAVISARNLYRTVKVSAPILILLETASPIEAERELSEDLLGFIGRCVI